MTRLRRSSPVHAFGGFVLLALYIPIIIVVINSVNADSLLAGWGGFTMHWYSVVVHDPRVRADFLTSAEVAFASTAISIVIAICAGLWYRKASPRKRRLLEASTYLRIAVPEVVLAVGLFVLMGRVHFPLGVTAIVFGHVVFNSAYATIIIQARLSTMSATYEEAARDLGAPPHRVFLRATLPLMLPAIVTAALLTLTLSFDDVVTSLFLGGTHAETLPVLLLGMIRIRVNPEVNAIAVGVMAITLSGFVLAVAAASVRGTLLGRRQSLVEAVVAE